MLKKNFIPPFINHMSFLGYELEFFTFGNPFVYDEDDGWCMSTKYINFIEWNTFINALSFLYHSHFSFKRFERNDPSLILDVDASIREMCNRIERMQRLETVTVEKVKVIKVKKDRTVFNGEESFKSEECVICYDEKPSVMFCSCGHIAICTKCNELNNFEKCPICRKENYVKRKLSEFEKIILS